MNIYSHQLEYTYIEGLSNKGKGAKFYRKKGNKLLNFPENLALGYVPGADYILND